MFSKGPGVGGLVSRKVLLGGCGSFKRWGLVEGIYITKDVTQKEIVCFVCWGLNSGPAL
jgi:hypothetical protein